MKTVMTLVIVGMMVLSGILGVLGTVKSEPKMSRFEEFNEFVSNPEHLDVPSTPQIDLSKSDGYFTENRGQWDNNLSFVAETSFGRIGLGEDGIYYCLRKFDSFSIDTKSDRINPMTPEGFTVKEHIVRVSFINANKVQPYGSGQLSNMNNYFIGNDNAKWITQVPNFNLVVYEDLWPGINLEYSINENGIKYEFQVLPGANPNDIRLAVSGAEVINKNTELELGTTIGSIMDSGLSVRTEDGRQIDSTFIADNGKIGFSISDYDKNQELIIDPLIYSTYLGGPNDDWVGGSVIDSEGNTYISGDSYLNFPTTPGSYDDSNNGGLDIIVVKMDANGTNVIYSTFIGGSNEGHGKDIEIDGNGNAVIVGSTESYDFPTTGGAHNMSYNGNVDMTVTKINPMGSNLIYSTYIGGSNSDYVGGSSIDANGNIYLTGMTISWDFPNSTGAYDIFFNGGTDTFLTKLNPTGTGLTYSTYLGGNDIDEGWEVTVDSTENAYLVGSTESYDFPTSVNAYDTLKDNSHDVFVTKFNNMGTDILFSTFIGGNDYDEGTSIALDPNNNVYASGYTYSTDFPCTAGAYETVFGGTIDVWIAKLNYLGDFLNFSTYLGGSNHEWCHGLTLDRYNNSYVVGMTCSSDFPTSVWAFDRTFNGGSTDIFISIISDDGSIIYNSTFFGGSQDDSCFSISVDMNGYGYITGSTSSTDLPISPNAYDTNYNGGVWDILVAKFYFSYTPSQPRDPHIKTGDRFVNLTWISPLDPGYAAISGYNIYRNGTTGIYSTINSDICGYNDTNVINGIEYAYNVTAVNALGEGGHSIDIKGTPMAAPERIIVISTHAGNKYINMSWNQPGDGGTPINNYSIWRGNSSNNELFLKDLNATTFNDTDLINGQRYYYRLSAINKCGPGPLSEEVNATPGCVPSEPVGLAAASGNGFVNLSWLAPADNGGSSDISYNVTNGNDNVTFQGTSPFLKKMWLNHTGLTNGVKYFFKVRAMNSWGNGPYSATINATPMAIPSQPLNIDIFSGNGFCNLSWEQPSSDGGLPILEYSIYRGESQGILEKTGYTKTTFYNDTGVTNGIRYYYQVCAKNAAGEGAPSIKLNATPQDTTLTLNHLPTFISSPTSNAIVNVEWKYTPFAIDEDLGDIVTLSLESGPLGMTYASGLISWYPTLEQIGNNSVIVSASDQEGMTYQSFTVLVGLIAPVNHAPIIDPVSNMTINEGELVSVQLHATDLDGDTLTYIKISGPPDATVNGNGSISWQTEKGDEGRYLFLIRISDSKTQTDIAFSVTVKKKNVEEQDDDTGMTDDMKLFIIIAVFSILLILIIIAIILFVVLRNKKLKDETGEKTADEEPEIEESDDIFVEKQISEIKDHGVKIKTGKVRKVSHEEPENEEEKLQPVPEGTQLLPPASEENDNNSQDIPSQEPQVTEPPIQPPIVQIPQPSPPPKFEEPPMAAIKAEMERYKVSQGQVSQQNVYHEDTGKVWSPEMVESRTSSEAMSAIQMLKQLNELKTAGAITQEEYEVSKKRLLRKI